MKFYRAAWWVQSPLMRILIAFAWGIGWAILQPGHHGIFLPGFLLSCLACLVASLPPFRWKKGWDPVRGFSLFCLFLFAGGFHVVLREKQDDLPGMQSKHASWILTVRSDPAYTRSGIRFEASLAQKVSTTVLQHQEGISMVYLRDSLLLESCLQGTKWAVSGSPAPIPRINNPGAPDIHGYFLTRGIQYQLFLEPGSMTALPMAPAFSPNGALGKQKKRILQTLRENFHDPKVLGLAEAILLGYKADLDPTVNSAFARTGVSHVIAISGMHLSLIFTTLMSFFRFIPAGRPRTLVSLFLGIPAIWWFSLLTGGSASAIRSAIMCSLPVTGLVFSRKILSLNNLSASCLLMLFYQPQWLRDPGFQLSFAALLGILVWQSSINGWLRFHNPALKTGWSLVSVTLAAQVFTTPIVVFYFHQFPLLFLFANICAVPLSSLALLLEILLCACTFSDRLTGLLAPLCEGLLRILLISVDGFSRIPGAVWKPLHLEMPVVFFLCLNILLLKSWLTSREPRKLLIFIASLILTATTVLHDGWQTRHQDLLAVLHQRNASIIAQVRGRSARIYLASGDAQSTRMAKEVIDAFVQHFGIRDPTVIPLPAFQNAVLRAGNRAFIIARSSQPPAIPLKDSTLRILILCRGAGAHLPAWQEKVRPGIVVIDGSHPLWKIQQWEKDAEKLPLRLHLTARHGAFLLDCHNSLPYAKKN